MAVDAFVLPHPGRTIGVVFWQAPRRADARHTPAASGEEFRVYAPDPLSAGEVATLQAGYLSSLASALGEAARTPGSALIWWWILGLVALICLTLRAIQPGPDFLGMGWMALAAAATALPAASGRLVWPAGRGRAHLARRLARQAAGLRPAAGGDARHQERVGALWRQAARLRGTPAEQLRALEDYCHELAWPQAAAVYAKLRGGDTVPAPRLARWLRRLRPPASDRRLPPYTVVEMATR